MEASGAEAAAAAAVTAGLMPDGDSWSAVVVLVDDVVVPVVLGGERCSKTEDGLEVGEKADFRTKGGTKEEEVLDDAADEENAVTTGRRAPKM